MGIVELLVLAVGLSMDAFAVSVCKGLSMRRASAEGMVKCGVWFGSFQALMPLLGFWLGSLFAEVIQTVDHWVAFALLVLIGVNMLKEALSKESEGGEKDDGSAADFSAKTMFTMAVATSVDALAVGISLAMAGDVNIWVAIALIGCITCGLSALGVKIGSVFGAQFEKKAQLTGGIILVLLGVKILLEHLEVH